MFIIVNIVLDLQNFCFIRWEYPYIVTLEN
jgi:hypothetical protein